MSDYWLEHLSHSLSEQGMVAYIWYIDEDRIEWAGDIETAFGFGRGACPQNHAAFNALINPQYVPARLAAVHEAVSRHVSEGGEDASFSLHYQLRNNDGSYAEIREKSLIHQERRSGSRIICGTLYLQDRKGKLNDCGGADSNITTIKKPSGKTVRRRYAEDRTGLVRKLIDFTAGENKINHEPRYILAIGLDRTGMMNEALGAAFTDNYILKSWEKLRRVIKGANEVHRIDGDVFAVCVSGHHALSMAACAQRILNAFRDEPLHTGQGLYSVSVSIGGVMIDAEQPDCDPATLVTRAEMAMQMAKEKGRGCFSSYSEVIHDMDENKTSSAAADTFLSAFYDGRIQLAYQPVMYMKDDDTNFKNGKISFYECFMRFFDENGRGHSAGDFVPALERLGMITMIDKYVSRMAIHELRTFPDISLAVNVSARSLSDNAWLDDIIGKLRSCKNVAERFIVEITETAAVDNMAHARKVIASLQSCGVQVALDDFGAGYTSFAQLKMLGVDIVKIDKSFVHGLSKKENRLFIHALQALAGGMNIKTVAEGAETPEDVAILKDHGVDYIQGYFYGYPGVERLWLPEDHKHRFVPFNFRDAARRAAAKENSGSGFSGAGRAAVANG